MQQTLVLSHLSPPFDECPDIIHLFVRSSGIALLHHPIETRLVGKRHEMIALDCFVPGPK